MSDCKDIEMQQLRRMQELQQENDILLERLNESESLRESLNLQVAELEEKCQDLSERLAASEKSERWIRREYDMLAAQMEIVQLIFGGNKCGGCG